MARWFDSFVLRWPNQRCASLSSSSSIYYWSVSDVCKSDTSGSRIKVTFAVMHPIWPKALIFKFFFFWQCSFKKSQGTSANSPTMTSIDRGRNTSCQHLMYIWIGSNTTELLFLSWGDRCTSDAATWALCIHLKTNNTDVRITNANSYFSTASSLKKLNNKNQKKKKKTI